MDDGGPLSPFVIFLIWLRWWAIPYALVGLAVSVMLVRAERRRGALPEPGAGFRRAMGAIAVVALWPLALASLGYGAWSSWREGRRYRPMRRPPNSN